jgi:hypothetical protein
MVEPAQTPARIEFQDTEGISKEIGENKESTIKHLGSFDGFENRSHDLR